MDSRFSESDSSSLKLGGRYGGGLLGGSVRGGRAGVLGRIGILLGVPRSGGVSGVPLRGVSVILNLPSSRSAGILRGGVSGVRRSSFCGRSMRSVLLNLIDGRGVMSLRASRLSGVSLVL